MILKLMVFLPLFTALVAGLGRNVIGRTAAKVVTTGGLFVSCAIAWFVFSLYLTGLGEAQVVPVLDWIRSGDMVVD